MIQIVTQVVRNTVIDQTGKVVMILILRIEMHKQNVIINDLLSQINGTRNKRIKIQSHASSITYK